MKKEGDLLVSRKVSLFFLLLFRTLFRPLMRPEPQCAATHGIHQYVCLHDASMGILLLFKSVTVATLGAENGKKVENLRTYCSAILYCRNIIQTFKDSIWWVLSILSTNFFLSSHPNAFLWGFWTFCYHENEKNESVNSAWTATRNPRNAYISTCVSIVSWWDLLFSIKSVTMVTVDARMRRNLDAYCLAELYHRDIIHAFKHLGRFVLNGY